MRRRMILPAIALAAILLTAALAWGCAGKNSRTVDAAHVHADGSGIVGFFGGGNATKVYASGDRKEGKTVVFETTGTAEDPFIYFDYEGYVRSLGFDPVSADEYKYVVLKIRQEKCNDSNFELFFAAGRVTGATGGYSRIMNFDNTVSGWQYLIYDLSAQDFTGTVHGFRFDYMTYSANEGEKLHFASLTFLKTANEINDFMRSQGKEDPHLLSAARQKEAEKLLSTVTLKEADNTKLTAEHEDASIDLWFDHTYTKTPAESTLSTGRNSYLMYLARNEAEDCQFLLSSEKDAAGLTAKISRFSNGSGAELRTELYYGYYFENVKGQSIVDPLPPLDGPFDLKAGRSSSFVIKIFTYIDTPAGDYEAVLSIFDAEGREIKKAKVYARVYGFTLPEATTCKTQMDLSWYNIYVNHECWEGDEGVLYRKYYDLLLENRICAYTLPYSDQGAYENEILQEYVKNPRVVAFNPIGWKVDPNAANVSSAYAYLSQDPEWLAKAYFYHVDEPLTVEMLDHVIADGKIFAEYFPGYHYIVPMHYDLALDGTGKLDFFEYVKDYVNAWCPHNFFFNTFADYSLNPLLTYRMSSLLEKNLGTFPERMAKEQAEGDDVWWYVTRYPQSPEITVSIETQAVRLRILFWQQKLYNVDNFLYYLVNDWYPARDAEGNSDFGFNSKHETATGATPYDIYGNGVLVYSGHYLGIEEPIGSLRLECIRDGIEDFEYLTMFEKLYGSDALELVIKQVTTSLGQYTTDEEVFTRVRCILGQLIEDKQ